MSWTIAICVACKPNASSPLKLINCTDHKAVVRYSSLPTSDCSCDVELHEASRAIWKDNNWWSILRNRLCVSVIQTKVSLRPIGIWWTLGAGSLILVPGFFHQMNLHITGNKRGSGNGMPAGLMCVDIVQVHLRRYDLVSWAVPR